jgi:hypothetical protein
VLLRLVYLSVTNMFALLRLLASDLDKDTEILVLPHQITVLQRQLGGTRPRFSPSDRAFLAALLYQLPRGLLDRVRLLACPDTMLRWHRDLLAACGPTQTAHVLDRPGHARRAGQDHAQGAAGLADRDARHAAALAPAAGGGEVASAQTAGTPADP